MSNYTWFALFTILVLYTMSATKAREEEIERWKEELNTERLYCQDGSEAACAIVREMEKKGP